MHYEHCIQITDAKKECRCQGIETRAIRVCPENIGTMFKTIRALTADGYKYTSEEQNMQEKWSILTFTKI